MSQFIDILDTQRRRLIVEVQDELKAANFFKTVKRGRLPQNCNKPACLIVVADWDDKLAPGITMAGRGKLKQSIRVVLGVFVDTSQDSDRDNDLLETAIGHVQKVMERGGRKLGGNAITVVPMGGNGSALEEVTPIADSMLTYRVDYERTLGEP